MVEYPADESLPLSKIQEVFEILSLSTQEQRDRILSQGMQSMVESDNEPAVVIRVSDNSSGELQEG